MPPQSLYILIIITCFLMRYCEPFFLFFIFPFLFYGDSSSLFFICCILTVPLYFSSLLVLTITPSLTFPEFPDTLGIMFCLQGVSALLPSFSLVPVLCLQLLDVGPPWTHVLAFLAFKGGLRGGSLVAVRPPSFAISSPAVITFQTAFLDLRLISLWFPKLRAGPPRRAVRFLD